MLNFIVRSFLILLLTCTTVFGQIRDSSHVLSETDEASLQKIISRLNKDDIEVEIITQTEGEPLSIAQDYWNYWHTNPHRAKFHIILVHCGTPTDAPYYTAVYGLKQLVSQEDINHVLSILKQNGRLSPATAFTESLTYIHKNNHATSNPLTLIIILIVVGFIVLVVLLSAMAKPKENHYELSILGFLLIIPITPYKGNGNGSGCSSAGGCSSGCSSGCGGCGGGGCGS